MPLSNSNDIVQMILNAGPMVRLVLLLLLFFSITSWAIIFYKYRFIRKARKESAYFLDLFWNRQSLSKAFSASKQLQYSPLARVFRIAYLELKKVNNDNDQLTAAIEHLSRMSEPGTFMTELIFITR